MLDEIGPRQQGQGRDTKRKEGLFGLCLGWHLKANRSKLARSGRPYIHVDLNAGNGRNHLVGCKGTPLLFIDAAEKHDVRSIAYFVDKRKSILNVLKHRLQEEIGDLFGTQPLVTKECILSDNAKFLDALPSLIWQHDPSSAVGCLLADPNGISQERGGFPLRSLGEIAKRLPNFIVLIHWNFSAAYRTAGYRRNHPGEKMSTLTLDEILSIVDRRHWLIGSCIGSAVLCGSNERVPEHKAAGLLDMSSSDGRILKQRCSGKPQ